MRRGLERGLGRGMRRSRLGIVLGSRELLGLSGGPRILGWDYERGVGTCVVGDVVVSEWVDFGDDTKNRAHALMIDEAIRICTASGFIVFMCVLYDNAVGT